MTFTRVFLSLTADTELLTSLLEFRTTDHYLLLHLHVIKSKNLENNEFVITRVYPSKVSIGSTVLGYYTLPLSFMLVSGLGISV